MQAFGTLLPVDRYVYYIYTITSWSRKRRVSPFIGMKTCDRVSILDTSAVRLKITWAFDLVCVLKYKYTNTCPPTYPKRFRFVRRDFLGCLLLTRITISFPRLQRRIHPFCFAFDSVFSFSRNFVFILQYCLHTLNSLLDH